MAVPIDGDPKPVVMPVGEEDAATFDWLDPFPEYDEVPSPKGAIPLADTIKILVFEMFGTIVVCLPCLLVRLT